MMLNPTQPKTPDPRVEVVARAAQPETFLLPRINLNKPVYERAYSRATAALAALDAHYAAMGLVLVPREASAVMQHAGANELNLDTVRDLMEGFTKRCRAAESVYAAMIAAGRAEASDG